MIGGQLLDTLGTFSQQDDESLNIGYERNKAVSHDQASGLSIWKEGTQFTEIGKTTEEQKEGVIPRGKQIWTC